MIAYSFLTMFFVMAGVNIFLVFQIRAKERSLEGRSAHFKSFKREKRTLAIILFFFELSYLLRFFWDDIFAPEIADSFAREIVYDLIAFADGLAFTALLIFHKNNFTER